MYLWGEENDSERDLDIVPTYTACNALLLVLLRHARRHRRRRRRRRCRRRLRPRQTCYVVTSLRLRWECHIQNVVERLCNLAQLLSNSDAF
jgi:hypothetical protein